MNEYKGIMPTKIELTLEQSQQGVSNDVLDFQDSPDDEEDTRSSQEYMNDLEIEFHERAFLAKSKRFFKREEVSSNDNEMVEVKVLMALANDESSAVGKESARNGEWVKISMRKENTKILKENQALRKTVLTRQKDLVFVKSSTEDTNVSKPNVERPWLSEAKGFNLLNYDTGRILSTKSHVNVIESSVTMIVTDSSVTDYDSAKESTSVCSTPLSPLEKLPGAEPQNELQPGPKTIKSILKACSTRKDETSKDVIINEIINYSAPAKGTKNVSASKKNSASFGKLKNVITEVYEHGSASQNSRKGEALQAKKVESLNANRLRLPPKGHITGVKSYLHKYVEQPGPKVVFGDDSTCTTEGYGSIKCNGIVFTKVAFVIILKYNLVSISQLCDAKYIVQFDENREIIFNSNKEVVMIAHKIRDVYVFDMTSSVQESCFFAKASESLNWNWHKRFWHLNFKTINQLAKQNLVIALSCLLKRQPMFVMPKGKTS
ncbi:retrovirus-related pol polyprotein from transposon TNT 1-94 [Tanacetum coccineum]